MNIFQSSLILKKQADSKNTSSLVAHRENVKLPYFKGNMRRKGTVTSAFLINYFTVLAACIVQAENQAILNVRSFCVKRIPSIAGLKGKKPKLHKVSIYLIEALLSSEGFTLADYKQGSNSGSKSISKSLTAFSVKENLGIVIDKQGNVSGLTPEIINSCLSAI